MRTNKRFKRTMLERNKARQQHYHKAMMRGATNAHAGLLHFVLSQHKEPR